MNHESTEHDLKGLSNPLEYVMILIHLLMVSGIVFFGEDNF